MARHIVLNELDSYFSVDTHYGESVDFLTSNLSLNYGVPKGNLAVQNLIKVLNNLIINKMTDENFVFFANNLNEFSPI